MRRAGARWISFAAVAVAVAVLGGVARAEEVTRNPSETDDAFMARVLGPSARPAQKVVRSSEIANGKSALIGFVNGENVPLVGHLLIEMAAGRYEHVHFPSCDVEGDTPRLLAVFFARTGKGGRDLAVLCSWDANHADVDGTLYGAEFYRLKDGAPSLSVEPLTELNAKFKTADLAGVDEHGKRFREKAKFKTVADVKNVLAKMGLKQ